MTVVSCAGCPWQGPHLRALWEHLRERHLVELREIMLSQVRQTVEKEKP